MPKNAIGISAVLLVAVILCSLNAEDLKDTALHQRADTTRAQMLYPIDYAPRFAAETVCTVRMAGDAYWAVSDWVIGDEIYKTYQDPSVDSLNCSYPFEIDAVAMHLQFAAAGSLYASADIEALHPDLSLPSCPYPGGVIDISEEQTFYIPQAGGYLIMINFEEPVTVTEPYFCGFFFAGDVTALGIEVVLDNDPYLCVNWNDWGEGYVDLVDNEYYDFPGNLVLYSIGRSGGSTETVLPQARMAWPHDSAHVSSNVHLRATELVDTILTSRCTFEYYHTTNGWTEIGTDYNADVTLRNGVGPASYQEGYSYSWDASSMAEGWYYIRSTIYDATDNVGADTISIYLDNTPLEPEFTNPVWGDTICDSVTFTMDLPDEDVSFMQFEYIAAQDTIVASPAPLLQSMYGDTDDDTTDGNYYTNGEFGEFYNAPTLLAGYIRYFANSGYPDIAKDGGAWLTDRDIVEELADSMQIRQNLGAEDDNFIWAVEEYFKRKGDDFDVRLSNSLSIEELDYIMGYRSGAILGAIGQPYGHWLGITQVDFSSASNGEYPVNLYETKTGSIIQSTLRFNPLPEVMYNGSYRVIDLALGIYPKAYSASNAVLGLDFNPADGFSYYWDIPEIDETVYYIAGKGADNQSHTGEAATRLVLSCEADYISGDTNGDGSLNVSDAVWLLNYVFDGGPEPLPVLMNGDTNCDSAVNVSDAVWLINYVFVGGPPPCN
ncbi:MAG: hypothetical protein GF310_07750 [candidate division Zixibacteria bacterium]|nr:hypothetical protein [candidate division Zixibacteria bacterium]